MHPLLFSKIGRAMLRPIFDQKSRRDGQLCNELRRSLQWWLRVLGTDMVELRPWKPVTTKAGHLFCDASANPAQLGAVSILDGTWWWCHYTPPAHILSLFSKRNDNQIMGLELLAVALGLSTFADKLRSRRVVIHCDNTGSEASVCIFGPLFSLIVMTGVHAQRVRTRVGPCAARTHAVAACSIGSDIFVHQESGNS